MGNLADVAVLKIRLQQACGYMTVPPCVCHHLQVNVLVALMAIDG